MTPLLCRCGYLLTALECEPVRAMCCDACRAVYLVETEIDEQGVGPDRLVPVEGDVGAG